MFVLILALLFLHLPTQSPSIIILGGLAMRTFSLRGGFFILFFTLSLRAENNGYLLLVSEPSNTPKRFIGGFQTHRFRVPCIILDTLDVYPDWVCICWLVPAISLLSPQDMHKRVAIHRTWELRA